MSDALVPIGAAIVAGLFGLIVALAKGWFQRSTDTETRDSAYADRLTKRLEKIEGSHDANLEKINDLHRRLSEVMAEHTVVTTQLAKLTEDFERVSEELTKVEAEASTLLAFVQLRQLYGAYLEWTKSFEG